MKLIAREPTPEIITALHTAQAELAKRDARIASLTSAGAEYQRQCFEQAERIKELEFFQAQHVDKIDEQAAEISRLREALAKCKETMVSSISDLQEPNFVTLASPALNRVKAEALRDAADEFDAQGEWKGHGQQLRNMADAIEKGEG